MLLGAEFHIYTDHKNILNVGDSSERRLRWISYVDEYGPTSHYIEGPRNGIADTFSRLLRKDVPSVLAGKKVAHIVRNSESNNEIESLVGAELENSLREKYFQTHFLLTAIL